MAAERIFRKDRRRAVIEPAEVDSFIASRRLQFGLSESSARWEFRDLEEHGTIQLRGYEDGYDWEDDPLAIWFPAQVDPEADEAQEEAGEYPSADSQLRLALPVPPSG